MILDDAAEASKVNEAHRFAFGQEAQGMEVRMGPFRVVVGSLILPCLAAAALSSCGGNANESGALTAPGATGGWANTGSTKATGSTAAGTQGTTGSSPGVDVSTNGPGFPGAGTMGAGAPITATPSPTTCGGAATGQSTTSSMGPEVPVCYFPENGNVPAAVVERVVEVAQNQQVVHVRLTLSPSFVDNTYGDTAVGWGGTDTGTNTTTTAQGADAGTAAGAGDKAQPGAGPGGDPAGPGAKPQPGAGPGADPAGPGAKPQPGAGGPADDPAKKKPGRNGHTFKDLVESDKAEFKMTDASGALVLDFYLDYISQDSTKPSGYGCLGVSGGEGKMLTGNSSAIVAATTSLDRDLNACGYGSYLTDSPATDDSYTPNAAAPGWDYRVVYDVWVKASAFGSSGFGNAAITYVHASPSKASSDTVPVTPGPCPPGGDGGQGGGSGQEEDAGQGGPGLGQGGQGGEPNASYTCQPDGEACSFNIDCCSGVCCRGICSAGACVQ